MVTYSTYQALLKDGNFEKIFQHFDNEKTEKLLPLLVERKLFEKLRSKQSGLPGKQANEITEKFWNNFWQHYIIDSPHANFFFEHQYLILGKHFAAIKKPEPAFIEKIAKKYPSATIKALRVSRRFIETDFLASLAFLEKNENTYLQKHYALFRKLQLKEKNLWDNAVQGVEELELNSVQWLYILFLHHLWNTQRPEKEIEKPMDHYIDDFILFQSYNTFLSYHISRQIDLNFNEASVIRSIRELLSSLEKVERAMNVLQYWVDWYSFVHKELNQYCFNLNYDIKEVTDEQIILAPGDLYRQSLRYASVIRQSMFFAKIRNHALHSAQKIIIEKYQDGKMNETDQIRSLSELFVTAAIVSNYSEASLLSAVYCLDPRESGKLDKMLLILSLLQVEARNQYSVLLTRIRSNNFYLWLMDVHEVLEKYLTEIKSGSNPLPLFLLSEIKFDNKLHTGMFEPLTLNDLMGLLVDYAAEKKRPFNRFDPFFSFYETPFIQFGSVITGIKTLLGTQDPGILALETYMKPNYLRGSIQSEESIHFEKELAKKFTESGFQNVFLNVEVESANRNTTGEIDILILEDKECLLVEIKRTRLPMTGYELFLEEEYTLRKASEQLTRCMNILGSQLPITLRVKAPHEETDERELTIGNGMNFHGCIISMHCNMDTVLFGSNIYKTSFAELALGEVMEHCKEAKGNRIAAFLKGIKTPYIPEEYLKNPTINFDISI